MSNKPEAARRDEMPKRLILGMEPQSVCWHMIRTYLAGRPPEQPITKDDCEKLMMEFNKWLIETNETWQRLVLDKINTELPAPKPIEAAPSVATPDDSPEHVALCQACSLLNQGDTLRAHQVIREALAVEAAPDSSLSKTECSAPSCNADMDQCGATSQRRYVCTIEKGHSGPHEARGTHERGHELFETWERALLSSQKKVTTELEQSRAKNRELNRRVQALEHALAKESGKGSWYGYWTAANQLFKQVADYLDKIEPGWVQKVFGHERAAASPRADGPDAEVLLRNLLAVIHRDGGHYTDAHGLHKSANDAEHAVFGMLAAQSVAPRADKGIQFSPEGIELCKEIVRRELARNPEGTKAAFEALGFDYKGVAPRAEETKPEDK